MYVTRDKSREEENSEAFARQKEIEPSDSIYEGSCLIIWEVEKSENAKENANGNQRKDHPLSTQCSWFSHQV